MPELGQLRVAPDLLDHAQLEAFLESPAHGRGLRAPLRRGVAHHHHGPAERGVRLQRLEDRRAAGDPAVHEQGAVHFHGREEARHGGSGHEHVHRHRPVVEHALLAAREIGGGHEQPNGRGLNLLEVEGGADELAQRRGIKERLGLIEHEQGEPAREEAREEEGQAQRVDLLAGDASPHRLEPVGAAARDHGGVQRARGRARDEANGESPLDEHRRHPRFVGALGAAARQHERHGRGGIDVRGRALGEGRRGRHQDREQCEGEDPARGVARAPVKHGPRV